MEERYLSQDLKNMQELVKEGIGLRVFQIEGKANLKLQRLKKEHFI